jgi:serine/threonine-protein kinase
MPLEQLRAQDAIDLRCDIYALGVVLYEMLAGVRPYVARNAADFAALITSAAPAPLSQHRPELRGAREAAVMKALGRNPESRHASVDAFIAALEHASNARKRVWRVVALVAAVAVMAGWGLQAWQARRAAAGPDSHAAAGRAATSPRTLPAVTAEVTPPPPQTVPPSELRAKPTPAPAPAKRSIRSKPLRAAVAPDLRLDRAEF